MDSKVPPMTRWTLPLVLTLSSLAATAAPMKKTVGWTLDGEKYEGVLVYDAAVKTPRPGLVLVPNWLGVTDAAVKQAVEVAGSRYVILVADVYGVAHRPKDTRAAGAIAGALKGDRAKLRARVKKSLEVLLAQAKTAPLDTAHIGAIGFCFGGTTALELARAGADIAGVVSFHGGLSSPKPDDAKAIKGKVLALHGANDPSVPPAEVQAFEDEMRNAKVDWQLVAYGNAVHSFTDIDADMPGQSQYNATVARRAYRAMNDFFDELFKR